MNKTIKVSENTHLEFTKIQGELVSTSGKKVNQDNALMVLIKNWRKNKK